MSSRRSKGDGGTGVVLEHQSREAPLRHTFTDHDTYLFRQGAHSRLYEKLGAHLCQRDGRPGALFAVWAPNALRVSVIGSFNDWDPSRHPMKARNDGSGIWEVHAMDVERGALYKFHIVSRLGAYEVAKGDPFAQYWEAPPRTASVVWDLDYPWGDARWMAERARHNSLRAPWSVYEMHLGSWRRGEGNRLLTYGELAPQLITHVRDLGYTHVEFLPVMEHPFYGSWGYQTTGYFAPSARYGTPQDFMALVDQLHQAGIGVILDWVPSHFPDDQHGLAFFDGTHLFEHADPRQGFHPEWKSLLFNYGRHEVRAFLASSATFWMDKYHADALRVDAVASMLYLDYGRQAGEWLPNPHGGKENLEAIRFLKGLNESLYRDFPDTQTFAEESTSWPQVSRPVYLGGLGFGMKWNMGWMHDTLGYLSHDPVHRKYHHNQLTFSIWYAFFENFLLPLSHDEVVYGKGSLLAKMPGDDWQKFASLRLALGYMWVHPGKKLLFMGGDLAQRREWNHEQALDWDLLDHGPHQGVRNWVRDLNRVYREQDALHEQDFSDAGFAWLEANDFENSVLAFVRRSASGEEVVALCNFTPLVRTNYRVGVAQDGVWRELLNSDAGHYGGSGQGNFGAVEASPLPYQGRPCSLTLTLPPLGMLLLKRG